MKYLMLNPNDLHEVVGITTMNEVTEELKIKPAKFYDLVSRNKIFYKNCILIEDIPITEKEEEVFDKVLFYTDEKGRKYYALRNCTIEKHYKNGAVSILTPYKHHSKWVTKLYGKEQTASRIFAKAFIKPDLTEDDCCLVIGDELTLENIKIMSRSECAAINAVKVRSGPKVMKKVGLFKSNKCIKVYQSIREAGRELFMSYQTVTDICNGKVKRKLEDLRWV